MSLAYGSYTKEIVDLSTWRGPGLGAKKIY
jgi:hypothetical protein